MYIGKSDFVGLVYAIVVNISLCQNFQGKVKGFTIEQKLEEVFTFRADSLSTPRQTTKRFLLAGRNHQFWPLAQGYALSYYTHWSNVCRLVPLEKSLCTIGGIQMVPHTHSVGN